MAGRIWEVADESEREWKTMREQEEQLSAAERQLALVRRSISDAKAQLELFGHVQALRWTGGCITLTDERNLERSYEAACYATIRGWSRLTSRRQ